MRGAVALVLLVALTALVAVATPTAIAAAEEDPRIVAVYPNPAIAGDRGEFVVLSLPAGRRDGNLTLTDGETAVAVTTNVSPGRVAVATDPVARTLAEVPVVLVDGTLRLANSGERVELHSAGLVVDAVTYPRAPEGALYRRTATGWSWTRIGATSFPVRTVESASARVFVLPDAPEAAMDPLRTAQDRLWLGAYTLTSRRVVGGLCDAAARGIDVRVLVELEPVGGMTDRQAGRLDRLVACGVSVRAIGGPRARYAFHHAKYAVADDRAVVLTENWKPSGVGGRASRGWGVVVEDARVAAALAVTFEADATWRDSRPWHDVRNGRTFAAADPPANGTFPRAVTPVTVSSVDVELLVAPDNAERRVMGVLESATASIRVIQVSVGSPSQPFVRALVRAARQGVEVRLLLADAWYVREHNRAVADELNGLAREAGLPLRVRLATPRGRYGKIHGKGAVVDREHVVVGSLNWNNASARLNREVVVLLHGPAVGAYYASAFDADWQGGAWRVPVGLPAVALLLALAAAAFARRSIAFEGPADEAVVPVDPEVDFQEPY